MTLEPSPRRGPLLGPASVLFRALLRAFPATFRRQFGAAMEDSFAEGFKEAAVQGPLALSAFVLRTYTDAVRSGIRERAWPYLAPGPRRERGRLGMGGVMDLLLQDLRFAIRSLRRRPGFTFVAVATLGLGIGANAAIFSVVNRVLLRPLPFNDPAGLVRIAVAPSSSGELMGVMSYPDLADLEAESPSLVSVSGVSTTSRTLTGLGDAVVLDVARVTKGVLDIFHTAPVLGRDIRAEEFGVDGPNVVVLGYGFWQERFGGSDDVIGGTLELNGFAYEVVGVAPPDFQYPSRVRLWVPRHLDLEGCGRGCHTMTVVGRLAAGASVEQAQLEVDRIARTLQEAYPQYNTNKEFVVQSLQDTVVGDVRAGLWMLLGAVGFVLLIACANVANLLLVRASTRTGEVAVRSALGASGGRLIQQVLVESAVLATLGGIVGITLAHGGLDILQRLAAGTIPRMEHVSIDGAVLAYTSVAVVLVTLAFGLAPALGLARTPLAANLVQSGRGAGGARQGGRYRGLLLVTEVALSVMLLIGAGLLLRSFGQLTSVKLGFETQELLRFRMTLPESRYGELDEIRIFYRTLEERIRALPGVAAVGSGFGSPLGSGNVSGDVLVAGRPEPEVGQWKEASIRGTGPGWFETMGIPIVRGRSLLPTDDVNAEPVAVVSESFVQEHFPGEDPIGQRITLTVSVGYGSPEWRIVGVAGDVRNRALTRVPTPQVYVPHGVFGGSGMTLVVRGRPGTGPLLPAIREEVRQLDAGVPIYAAESYRDVIRSEMAPARLYLVLLGGFATLAVVLAGVGLYGVVAYLAAQRTREIGLRVALGARRDEIMRLVITEGMRPAVLGLLTGLTGAYFGARLLDAVLFGIAPRDPWIFASVAVLLPMIVLLATALPAYRASRIDPASALRTD